MEFSRIIKKIFPTYIQKRHLRESFDKDMEILRKHLERCKYPKIRLYDPTEKDTKAISNICSKLDVDIDICKFEFYYDYLNDEVLHVLCSVEHACDQNNKLLNAGVAEKNVYRVHVSADERFTKLNVYDTLLGYSREGDFGGFTVFGDINATKRIVILGNSTSDIECGKAKSWVEVFSETVIGNNDDYCVISGAIMAASSTQEMLRLYRDVTNLNPRLVVSYSGITDAYNEHFNDRNYVTLDYQIGAFKTLVDLYKREAWDEAGATIGKNVIDSYSYGLKSIRTRGENWIFNERLMFLMCKELNIEFVGILQPYLFSDRDCDIYHKYIIDRMNKNELEKTRLFYNQVRKEINKYPFLIDMSESFVNQDGIYKDYCHMLERGNIILAKKIYDTIEAYIR